MSQYLPCHPLHPWAQFEGLDFYRNVAPQIEVSIQRSGSKA
jgi:hypothetical protein